MRIIVKNRIKTISSVAVFTMRNNKKNIRQAEKRIKSKKDFILFMFLFLLRYNPVYRCCNEKERTENDENESHFSNTHSIVSGNIGNFKSIPRYFLM